MQLNKLIKFRQQVYQILGKAKNAQMDLLDAIVSSASLNSFVELSLSPLHQRQWHSSYAAIANSRLDYRGLAQVFTQQLGSQVCLVFSLDTTAWVHRRARTLQSLVLEQVPDKSKSVPAHLYSALSWIPEPHQSWALPMSTERVPWVGTAVQTGAAQIAQLCQSLSADSLKVITGDGGYGNSIFLAAVRDLDCTCVTRLRRDRVLYRQPASYKGKGRPRVHGAKFDFKDPTTWDMPDEALTFEDAIYGRVRLRRWNNLHMKEEASTHFDVIMADIHMGQKYQRQRWLAAINVPEGYHVQDIWHWYDHRYTIEPSFTFRKQHLYWTLPNFQNTVTCDRWTHLLDIAFWMLYLAQDLVQDCPLPWQKVQPQLTPRRVKQGMGALLAILPRLSASPKRRGNSPGWSKGRQRSPPDRYPVIRRRPKKTKSA